MVQVTPSAIAKAVTMAQSGSEQMTINELVTSEEQSKGMESLKKQNEDNARY